MALGGIGMRVCPRCIARNGLRGSDLIKGGEKDMDNDEKWADHLENEHGIPVIRKGETEKQAIKRCAKKGIVHDKAKCLCGDCKRSRKQREQGHGHVTIINYL